METCCLTIKTSLIGLEMEVLTTHKLTGTWQEAALHILIALSFYTSNTCIVCVIPYLMLDFPVLLGSAALTAH